MAGEPTAEHRESYVAALKAHDWHHEFSSDHRAYMRGRESLAALRQAQPLVDADFKVWNEHAPESMRVHVVPGQTGSAA